MKEGQECKQTKYAWSFFKLIFGEVNRLSRKLCGKAMTGIFH